jgi:RNA polymerase sigma-70 factor (ECF subfamily)
MPSRSDVPPMPLLSPSFLVSAELALSESLLPREEHALPPPPANEVSDVELVQRVLAGDEEAFGGIVARYHRRAFWTAFHVVGRIEDARDVTQDAFVRVYRSLRRFDFSRNFYTWFYRIVMNLAIDALRKRRSARAASLEDIEARLQSVEDTMRPVERQETRELVWSVLNRLDGKFKSVLVLRDIHGLSCREIAPILRVTHATVRWRLHRGRQLFREQWDRMHKDHLA